MEFLLVIFKDGQGVEIDRGVIIDDAAGVRWTNESIPLEAGTHVVTLQPPPDFDPPTITVVLQNTTPRNPKPITFRKI